MQITKTWTHINPRNHNNQEWLSMQLPQMDMWHSEIGPEEGEEGGSTEIRLIVFTSGSLVMELGGEYVNTAGHSAPKVIIQLTECDHGDWQDYTVEELHREAACWTSEGKTTYSYVLAKLRDLKLI